MAKVSRQDQIMSRLPDAFLIYFVNLLIVCGSRCRHHPTPFLSYSLNSWFRLAGLGFRAHVREQDNVADTGTVSEQHHQAVNAYAATASRRHAVFQRTDKVCIVIHRFLVTRFFCCNLRLNRAAWSSASFNSENPL